MSSRARLLTAAAAAAFALASSPGPARADAGAAARAFSDGQAAQLAGDFDHAAQSFELAYTIMPSVEALRSAARARQSAKQLMRAATLAEVLREKYPSDPAAAALARTILADARPRFGRLEIQCSAECSPSVGQRAAGLGKAKRHVVYIAPGAAVINVTFDDDQSVTRKVSVVAGAQLELDIAAPAGRTEKDAKGDRAVAAPGARRSRGGPRGVPVVMGVATLAVLGAGVWSGIDTQRAHDDYVASPTHDAFEDGRRKQLRTNLLFGGGAALGVATVLVGALWTDWSGGRRAAERAPVSVVPTAGGMAVTLGGTF